MGAAGQTGQTSAEFTAVSLGGFYAITVVANQVLGLRSLKRSSSAPAAVILGPTCGGGRLVFSGAF